MTDIELDRFRLAKIRSPLKRIPLLNAIALACQRYEVSYALELLREALFLSESAGKSVYLAQTNLNLARWLGVGGMFEEAFKHLSIAKSLFQKLKDEDALIDVQLVNAMILSEKGEFEEAFNYAELVYQFRSTLRTSNAFTERVLVSRDRIGGGEITEEISRRNNDLKLANATRVMAMVEASRMNFSKALYYLDANFELWLSLGETQEAATAMNNAGSVYARIREYPRAIEFFQRALAIYRSRGANVNMVTVLSNLGNIRREIGDYSTAFANLNEAMAILGDYSHPPSEIEVTLQFAKYYNGLQDYATAYLWATRSLEIINVRSVRTLKSEVHSVLGKILFFLKRYDEAVQILNEGLVVAEKTNSLESEVRCLKYLYLSMKDLGRIGEAFSFLERFQVAESSFLQNQLQLTDKAIQERFTTKFALTSDTVYRAENNSLTSDVERLTQELSRVMRQVKKKDDVLGKLKKESSTLVNYSRETQEILKPLLTKINQESRDSKYELDRAKKLQEVQPHFIRELRRRYPSLSKAEVKISGLLNLEMSSIEIASLLNVSVRTVENHRLHIRKKLQIDENQSIQEVLTQII